MAYDVLVFLFSTISAQCTVSSVDLLLKLAAGSEAELP